MNEEDELERFRRQWREEVRAGKTLTSDIRQHRGAFEPQPTHHDRSVSVTSSPEQKVHTELEPDHASMTALEIYEEAVVAERQGRMNDALSAYKLAFKRDPDIMAVYQRKIESQADGHTTEHEGARSDEEPVDELAFDFTRTVTVGADYEQASTDDVNHPSSTARLRRRLLKSYGQYSYLPLQMRVHAEETHEQRDDATVDDDISFHPADTDQPIPIKRLPPEMIHLICIKLVEPREVGFAPDIANLERLALVSRRMRLLTLDSSIWRATCLDVFRAPQIDPSDSAGSVVKKHHAGDYRRMFIEQPRIRTEGAYISVLTYVRRGESENVWVRPTHLVTFYRFLRFYSDGRVISLLSTEPPNDVVRRLDFGLRAKGVSFGRWKLRGSQVHIWDLTEPVADRQSLKYTFTMRCLLKTTHRGKQNKLELQQLCTLNRSTLEATEVPLVHSKPFHFSRVLAYEESR
ncbi:uncharacterized protein L969DRAFT_408516 [Mixia osmundae IAM 14324]|uniref:F-box domain-containing protein n=1 Tax=Mixia osmundae (strain CBS 9802 / IAM 14324 / JCM 22182 / KY 12970) TaxID=764103 RepID=G7E8S6_MIXOS|nr:uncharacterized protein L969DRAFT_408516 [Mixia osmundae IAM 14324]KEI40180.1 hypothetical protein L969DRAFT_408516 [Mixia osmundae IAM 14324]GAA99544.1 hypothetical protein E5Q_06245 [Mixia osmundae IAM 14324]